MCSADRRETESFLRHTLEQCSARINPCSTIFSASGQVCVLETSSRASGRGQEAWPAVCAPSKRPAGGYGGGHLRTMVTTPLWQLSLHIGRTSRGQGHPLVCREWRAPRLPEQPLSLRLRSRPNNDRHRNPSVPCSLRGSACASVLCPLCNIY